MISGVSSSPRLVKSGSRRANGSAGRIGKRFAQQVGGGGIDQRQIDERLRIVLAAGVQGEIARATSADRQGEFVAAVAAALNGFEAEIAALGTLHGVRPSTRADGSTGAAASVMS